MEIELHISTIIQKTKRSEIGALDDVEVPGSRSLDQRLQGQMLLSMTEPQCRDTSLRSFSPSGRPHTVSPSARLAVRASRLVAMSCPHYHMFLSDGRLRGCTLREGRGGCVALAFA